MAGPFLDTNALLTVWYVVTLLIGALIGLHLLLIDLARIRPDMPPEEIKSLYESAKIATRFRKPLYVTIGISVLMWFFFMATILVSSGTVPDTLFSIST